MFSPGICECLRVRAGALGQSLTLNLRCNLAWSTTNYKRFAVDQDRMALLPAAQTFELRPRLVVEPLGQLGTRIFVMSRRREVAEEGLRAQLAHLLAGSSPDGRVRGDETDAFAPAMLGC